MDNIEEQARKYYERAEEEGREAGVDGFAAGLERDIERELEAEAGGEILEATPADRFYNLQEAIIRDQDLRLPSLRRVEPWASSL